MMQLVLKRQGQITLEYISVAIMAMIGIIFMGGYVNRAINAYFHDAGGQVEDSFGERFDKQSPENTGLGLPGCECIPVVPEQNLGCGGICSDTQIQILYQDCSSPDCAGVVGSSSYCREELPAAGRTSWNSCFLSMGEYPHGTYVPATRLVTLTTGGWGNCGQYSCCTGSVWSGVCGDPGSAHEGFGLYDRYCGGNQFENWAPFWVNEPSCQNNCNDTIDPVEAAWCDPNGYNVGLVADVDLKFVDACSEDLSSLGSPYTEFKCLADCLGSQLVPPDHSTCSCPTWYPIDPTATECPAGYTKYDTWQAVKDSVCGVGVDCCEAFP